MLAVGGAANKIVDVKRIEITGLTTGTGPVIDVMLHKRTVADTTGTPVALTLVPHNSRGPAATAYINAYTANPTVGNSTGVLAVARVTLSTTAVFEDSRCVFDFTNDIAPVTLNSSAEQVCVNLNGATIAGGSLRYTVQLTERSTQ